MKTKLLTLTVVIAILASCSPGKDREVTKKMPANFPEQVNLEVNEAEFPLIARVEQLFLRDTTIIAQTILTEYGAYCLGYESLNITDSLYKIGQGPNEFVSPSILPIGNDSMFVKSFDSWWVFENNSILSSGKMPPMVALNDPSVLEFPILSGYTLNRSDGTFVLTVDIQKEVVLDSLTIPNLPDGTPNKFFMSATPKGDKIVLAFSNENKIIIVDMVDNMFGKKTTIEGYTAEGGLYYFGVNAANDKFYVINNNDIDLETGAGQSKIQVFDYEGNALKEYILPVCMYNPAINLSNGKAVSMGLDDTIYRYDLN